WPEKLARAFAYGSLIVFIAINFHEQRKFRKRDFDWQGYVPVIATVTWFEPLLATSLVRVVLPVMHAIQYAPFVTRAHVKAEPRRWVNYLALPVLILAGFAFFEWIPLRLVGYSPSGMA